MKPMGIVAAAVLGAVLVHRRDRLGRAALGAGAIACAALLAVGLGVVQLPNAEHVIREAGRTLGSYTYVLVGALAFLETAAGLGTIAPGEMGVILGGVSAGQGVTDPLLMAGIAWGAAVAGDLVSYALGRRLGRSFLLRHGPTVGVRSEHIERVERFYLKHGGKTILLGRFVGLVRVLSPFLAGASDMPLRRFAPLTAVAAGIWAAACVALGYVFWNSLDQALKIAERGSLALGAVIVVGAGLVAAYRHLRSPRARREPTGAG